VYICGVNCDSVGCSLSDESLYIQHYVLLASQCYN